MTRAATAFLFVLASGAAVGAQTTPAPAVPNPPAGSRAWVVCGLGFAVARAGCPTCDRAGVFTESPSLLFDLGARVDRRLDVGLELSWVSSKLEEGGDRIRTTFVLGVAQFRPSPGHGFFLKAGMGLGFVGNGLYSPIGPELAPPFTTNAFGLMYGAGWVFKRDRRFTLQLYGTHHIAALGELTTVSGTSVKNVVANFWTAGAGFVIR
jgi:hypothetical protein